MCNIVCRLTDNTHFTTTKTTFTQHAYNARIVKTITINKMVYAHYAKIYTRVVYYVMIQILIIVINV